MNCFCDFCVFCFAYFFSEISAYGYILYNFIFVHSYALPLPFYIWDNCIH